MFECKSCHNKEFKNKEHKFDDHLMGPYGISYGRCEVCGKAKECVDCKEYKKR